MTDGTSSSRSSRTPTELRTVARVVGAKGLSGAVQVEPLTDWPERLSVGSEVWPEGREAPARIERVESGGRVLVLHLAGVASRDEAEALVGTYLQVEARGLPEGIYYWDELEGLRVELPDGTLVGELVEVFRAGGGEVYRVVGPGGERLVPALRSVVLAIEPSIGRMVVAPDDTEEVR